ncbi:hypothetical protein NK553_28445 [Pseudomonas sp. ZM23]|uniref:SMODS-associating 2TM beta-strand rich effector domain-containing protein n=1 Tax=Pseudomonas triclosanedens TaxID=2961893 RepID=A0ABY6ZVA6_9PSED|nr:hypothetical protein [Pseudomonas triclosanedens]MCP8467886.1 hypothetical protein [Pseudomonas triclosanedens]MCP8473858.1 hypothetical protein [Pseudomonas triclosanedens]MCP8479816.1 hypothetical protein [Pseudomonas triclosanedens]WAI48756.1 hypothetical protein OU419_23840 [Pseudomonas triclosanedens]
MKEHEYSLLGGVNRAKVGRYIGSISAVVSGVVVFMLLSAVDLARNFNVSVNVPPAVLSLVGAGAVFAVLYAVFDKYIWRVGTLRGLLKIPDLAGEWRCQGKSLNMDGDVLYEWEGVVFIVQSWDKIRVGLRTDQSGSNSITAAVMYDEIDGYRLLYNYENTPRLGESDLERHVGFAELIFSKDESKAEGEYFNGRGRVSFGKIFLTRSRVNGR